MRRMALAFVVCGLSGAVGLHSADCCGADLLKALPRPGKLFPWRTEKPADVSPELQEFDPKEEETIRPAKAAKAEAASRQREKEAAEEKKTTESGESRSATQAKRKRYYEELFGPPADEETSKSGTSIDPGQAKKAKSAATSESSEGWPESLTKAPPKSRDRASSREMPEEVVVSRAQRPTDPPSTPRVRERETPVATADTMWPSNEPQRSREPEWTSPRRKLPGEEGLKELTRAEDDSWPENAGEQKSLRVSADRVVRPASARERSVVSAAMSDRENSRQSIQQVEGVRRGGDRLKQPIPMLPGFNESPPDDDVPVAKSKSASRPRAEADPIRDSYPALFDDIKAESARSDRTERKKRSWEDLTESARPESDRSEPPARVRESKPRSTRTLPDTDAPIATRSEPVRREPVIRTVSQGSSSQSAEIPAVSVEWARRSEVSIGKECTCELLVKNTGKSTAIGVEVVAVFPRTAKITGAVPDPETDGDALIWAVEPLPAGEQRIIQVKMIPTVRGQIAADAQVRFTGRASNVFNVSEPGLTVHLEGTSEVVIGDALSHVLTVSNPGTGVSADVIVEAWLSKGLEHRSGDHLLMKLGSLHPNETRSVRLPLAAIGGGRQTVQVLAHSGDLKQETTVEVNVIAPQITAQIDGPGVRYLGRPAVYRLTIANEGTSATENIVARHAIPEGFEYHDADRGVQYDAERRMVTWNVGRLERGRSAQALITLTAARVGDFKHLVRVTADGGTVCDTAAATVVQGAASLVLELADLDDPVEVGGETIYEVRIRNKGSAPARDLQLVCEIPVGLEVLKIDGPTSAGRDRDKLVFDSLRELSAGKSTVYRITARGTREGDLRVRARLSSESISEPMHAEEVTKFYEER